MLHTVNIEKIISGGLGLGRLDDGMIVLTKFVLPGERVRVKETKKRRGYMEALPVEILDGSPDRIIPPCPYFERCGGCSFQHMSYSAQLSVKKDIVQESLTRARVALDHTEINPVLPSPKTFHYRFRIRLQVTSDGKIGFYQSGSNNLIEISRCLVATERINTALQELTGCALIKNTGADLREIELLHSPADDRLFAVFHEQRGKKLSTEFFKEFKKTSSLEISIFLKNKRTLSPVGESTAPEVLSQSFDESICGRAFDISWSPGCFSQVNAEQNLGLIKLVCLLFTKTESRKLLELYCGMGNFSVPLGLSGATVTGYEQNSESIKWARRNAEMAGLKKFFFHTGDVAQKLNELPGGTNRFDAIVLDPPRQGLGKSTPLLASLEPRTILYISCDPATLARDLAMLVERGYKLTTLAPVDMFPQTHHIESVALLEKN